jgi:hypothetical protein
MLLVSIIGITLKRRRPPMKKMLYIPLALSMLMVPESNAQGPISALGSAVEGAAEGVGEAVGGAVRGAENVVGGATQGVATEVSGPSNYREFQPVYVAPEVVSGTEIVAAPQLTVEQGVNPTEESEAIMSGEEISDLGEENPMEETDFDFSDSDDVTEDDYPPDNY